MSNTQLSNTNKPGFLEKRKKQVVEYVQDNLRQPVSLDESKGLIRNTTDSIKQLGKGRQLSWPEYAAKMRFSSSEKVQKAYRNLTILFYLCLVGLLLSLLEIFFQLGNIIGGAKISLMALISSLFSLMIAFNLMVISAKELWMMQQEKTVDIHQWFAELAKDPWSLFPTSLDYEKAAKIFGYRQQKLQSSSEIKIYSK